MTTSRQTDASPLITPVLVAGCIIMLVSFAIRASFGVFQIPVAEEFGWARAEFSMAIAIQNLAWGIGQPIFGAHYASPVAIAGYSKNRLALRSEMRIISIRK